MWSFHIFFVVVTSFPEDVSKCYHRPVFAVQFLHEDNAIVFFSSDFFHHLGSSELFCNCLFHFLLDLPPHSFNTARVFPPGRCLPLCVFHGTLCIGHSYQHLLSLNKSSLLYGCVTFGILCVHRSPLMSPLLILLHSHSIPIQSSFLACRCLPCICIAHQCLPYHCFTFNLPSVTEHSITYIQIAKI